MAEIPVFQIMAGIEIIKKLKHLRFNIPNSLLKHNDSYQGNILNNFKK